MVFTLFFSKTTLFLGFPPFYIKTFNSAFFAFRIRLLALNAAKQVYTYLMKELLKLFPILGLASFMGLSIGCGGGAADVGDDTPPPADEPYDGGGADEGGETTEGGSGE